MILSPLTSTFVNREGASHTEVAVPVDLGHHIFSREEQRRQVFLALLDHARKSRHDLVVIVPSMPSELRPEGLLNISKSIEALTREWRYVVVGLDALIIRPTQAPEIGKLLDVLPTVFGEIEWLRRLRSDEDIVLQQSELFEQPETAGASEDLLHTTSSLSTAYMPSDLSFGHIPRVMFRSGPWQRSNLPRNIKTYLEAFVRLNPDFQQVYLDDDDAETYMAQYFPEYLRHYRSLVPGAFKIDVLRLCLLLREGGFYSDIGHLHKHPMGKICDPPADLYLVADLDFGVYNAFMGAGRNDPLIQAFLETVASNVGRQSYGKNPLDITGPHALGTVLHDQLGIAPRSLTPSGLRELKDGRTVYLLKHHLPRGIHIGTIVHQGSEGTTLVETKFPEYRRHMYTSRQKEHYSTMWTKRKVYQTI